MSQETHANTESGTHASSLERLVIIGLDIHDRRWLSNHPEYEPYSTDGGWRIPYLVSGDGVVGGGVGELNHPTIKGVIALAREYFR